MTRRASVPPADELFRKTTVSATSLTDEAAEATSTTPRASDISEVIELRANANRVNATQLGEVATARRSNPDTRTASQGLDLASNEAAPIDRARVIRNPVKKRGRAGEARPSGRTLHEEKITVYVSPEELIDLEQAKLALRANHGLAVDRGRIVREATALVVADLEARGEDSVLVRRLRGL
jgi:hypothetical protein